ncbi:hypothetical protein GGQ99_000968 [Aminobacter niigataensis]|uniref:Uncharacterized protein n=1 Tax=Aminobacter niigataensis TaxID=83265 RepID=A0ABR6KZP3_9HYPH|nr:hypothetical protein [Aminobacter niigataensis]MBB4649246.1 hypothetical protein [Aminobacter niigataensis]
MSGPFAFPTDAMDLDKMLESIGGLGWDGLKQQNAPAKVSDRFEPDDQLKIMMFAFSQTAEGRQLFEWIADLTFRAPYPHVGNTRDSAWLAAKAHEARSAVGLAVMQAIADGEKILNNKRSQAHEKPS